MKGKYLSEELKKYYERDGNKIVFKNGMTLNQLAMEMWERLGYEGIDPSALSRALKGERLLTIKQVDIFGETLKIDKVKRLKLRNALFADLSDRFGLSSFLYDVYKKPLIELFGSCLKMIQASRELDLTPMQGDRIENLLSLLKERIQLASDLTERQRLMEFYTETLIEADYFCKVALPIKKGFKRVLKVTNEVRELAGELENRTYLAVAYLGIGDAYFINGLYKEALDYLRESVSIFGPKSQKLAGAFPPLRKTMLCYSYLGMQEECARTMNLLLNGIEEKSPETRVFIYEALVRASANLGRKRECENFLKKGYEIYDIVIKRGNYDKLGKIHLIKAELESGKLLGNNDLKHLEEAGNEALQIAKDQGYMRLLEPINRLLNDILQ